MPEGVPVPAPELKPPTPQAEQVGLRVSLIPEEELNRRDPRAGFKKWLITVIVAAVLIGGLCVYLGVKIYLAGQQIAALDAQTDSIKKQSDSLASSVSSTKLTQARLRALGSLLETHRNVAPIFTFLEQHTLNEVAFSGISITENGSVNLTASASSYETYAGQLNEFKAQPEVKEMTASGLSADRDSDGNLQKINFTLSLTFDPSIFLIKKPADTAKADTPK